MMKIATGALAGAAALMLALTAPAMATASGKAEIVSSSAMVQTAGKKAKKAKKAAKPAGKSCGTFKYPDKKTGKCVDARNKKK